MRVFVTGATGFVGSAVVDALVRAGHGVIGLTRSDSGARALADKGIETIQAVLEDADALRRGIAAADAVIHTAFNHDFSRFADGCETDRRAIETIGAALEGSARPLLVTSGTALLTQGRTTTEADDPMPPSAAYPRASEAAAAALVARGVRASVVRLPPSVHGDGDHGFVPMLMDIARRQGRSAYVGDGGNRWPAVHRLDAAEVYRRAIERGDGGARFHAIAEAGVPFRAIAEAIARQLHVPAVSVSTDEAGDHFGWLAGFAQRDVPTSSAQTRALLQWEPTGPGLIADIDRAGYGA